MFRTSWEIARQKKTGGNIQVVYIYLRNLGKERADVQTGLLVIYDDTVVESGGCTRRTKCAA